MRSAFGAVAAAFVMATSAAGAAVRVSFPSPETYTDAALDRQSDVRAREATLRLIREHLEQLGQRHLARELQLLVEVLDVDLAGEQEPLRARAYPVRVMRDTTWPQIKLRFVLSGGDRVLARGEETLIDLDYLAHVDARLSSDPLRYEKRMLDEWFRNRILAAAGRH